MHKILFFVLCIILSCPVSAQQLEVIEKAQKLPDGRFSGYTLIIDGELETIEERWEEQLKETGKVRKKRAHWEIRETVMGNQVDLVLGTIVSLTSDSSVSIWLGAKLENPDKSIDRDIEEYLTIFGQEHYRTMLREEIQQTEDAAAFLSRQHQKLLNDNKNLGYELEEALKEHEKIKSELAELELEIEVIRQKIENNSREADKTLGDIQRTNSILESKKSSLKELN